jgi:hypothetical protein
VTFGGLLERWWSLESLRLDSKLGVFIPILYPPGIEEKWEIELITNHAYVKKPP